MARSPFQGNFQENVRPTVVTAPDAVVYINGETDLIGCPDCKRKFDLSRYITSIQVSLGIESVPGSASVNLSIPRHAVDDFFFDGNPIITPMMEIEIFSKGYYILEGLPQYYPIFWGIVTEVTDDYSGGEHTVTIHCADILKWWDICRMNVNAAFTAPPGQTGRNIYGNTFNGQNPYDVIWTLAQQSFGDVIIGAGSLTSNFRESGQRQVFGAALTDIMSYWNERFSRVRSNLLLYGINGTLVRGSSLHEYYQGNANSIKDVRSFASSSVRNAGGASNGQSVFDPTDANVTAFRTQFMQAGQINFWQSEYQTKLELAMACKEAIGFEFFMDVTGDIVFKPPFYNLDVLPSKPISWIQDIDIIDWTFSDSESEVVTQIQMQGSYDQGNIDYGFGEEITPHTSVTDYHLLRKYGWRPMPYNSEFMGDPALMFYHGMDILDRKNSRRHTASITIPCRPELRLGFPVYVAPKDAFWYVRGITHNIQFGGRATTTLDLTARRCKWIAPRGIGGLTLTKPNGNVKNLDPQILQQGSYHLDIGEAAQIPSLADVPAGKPNPNEPLILRHPKTGRLVGYPNAVMVYTRPLSDQVVNAKSRGEKVNIKIVKETPEQKKNRETNEQELNKDFLSGKYTNVSTNYNQNRYKYGLTSAGVYVYAHDKMKAVQQILLVQTNNITVTKEGATVRDTFVRNASGMIRPVSDERGFEVIGHFRYGRGISLRDGSLVVSDTGRNTRTNIDAQVALAGGLLETLTAQSQGLTTITNAYPNPAVAIADLMPEDRQTAGIKTPEGKFEFINTEAEFVQTAPLGSPEQKGLPLSVEASQLSRALTLAELTAANQDTDSQDCACMTGRADLAFINVGYQIKILNPSSTETKTFNGTSPGQSGEVPGVSEDPNGRPVVANSVYFSDIRNQVERYLTNLYSVLDDRHHQFEEELRTGTATINLDTPLESPVDLFSPPPEQFGEFTPPFSSINRANLGDPVAIAQQGSSASDQLGRDFRNFGRNLEAQSQVTAKQGEIRSLSREGDLTRARITQLQRDLAQAPPNTRSDLQNQLAVEEATLENTNAQIQQLQAEIDNIRASNV